MLSTVGPVIKELAKQAVAAAESGKSAKKGKGKEKDAAAVSNCDVTSWSPLTSP